MIRTTRDSPGRPPTPRAVAAAGPVGTRPVTPTSAEQTEHGDDHQHRRPPPTERPVRRVGRPGLLRHRAGRRDPDPGHPGRRRGLPDHPVDARVHRAARRPPRRPEHRGLHRAAAVRHAAGGGPRARSWPPRWPSAIALFITHYAPAPAGAGPRLRGRPAGRHPQHRLRLLGHRLARPAAGAPLRLAGRRTSSFIPLFAGPASVDRPHDAHRRPRARRHDPADHQRDLPRGLHPGARRCTARPRSPWARPAGR